MANWEVNKTKRYNKPIEEHDAKIRGQAFRIEASEGSDKGVLYLWNDLRGYERIAYGSVADLKRQAEGMGKREARGVAAIERRSNYSRPGQPDRFGIAEQVLRDGQVHLDFAVAREYLAKQTVDALRYILRDAKAARDAMGTEGKKFNYYADLVHEASRELKKRGFSRPGAKDTMGTNRRIIRARGHEFLAEDEGNLTRISIRINGRWELAAIVNTDNRTASEWIESNAQPGDPFRWLSDTYSRPGAKDTMAVEDRFYFGKGRKERFADDAKQIADTILKQLGGGRFIAMTGAKNLAYRSSPPGLSMSIGRGAKNGIKYFRVDYDRAMDTYTLIFMNNSGGTVREIPFVHAGEMRRVFTMTTGFDTSL